MDEGNTGGTSGQSNNGTNSSNPSDYPWFNSLSNWVAQSVNSAVSGFASQLDILSTNLGDGLRAIANSISIVFDGFADALHSIANGLFDIVDNIQQGVSSLAETFANHLKPVKDAVLSFIEIFNPSSEKFIYRVAFVPSSDFNSWLTEQKNFIEDKFKAFKILVQNVNAIKDAFTVAAEKPNLKLTLPSEWGGATVSIFNTDYIDPYINTLHMWISLTLIVYTIFKIYRMIPNIIY